MSLPFIIFKMILKAMIVNKVVIFLLLCFLATTAIKAQDFEEDSNRWIFGVFINGVNNSGEAISRPFKIREKYSFSNPIKISVEKRFLLNFGAELSLSNNKFKAGNLYNEAILTRSINYFSTDAVFKYYWTNLFYNPRRYYLEGFILTGPSVVILDDSTFPAGNLGGGFNIFLTDNFYLVFQGTAKLILLGTDRGSKLLQLDLGFAYSL